MKDVRISNLIVQKYGGATVSDPKKIKQIALRIAETAKQNVNLVVVVSAMGKTTNQLIELANAISSHPTRREMDMLLSTGERITMSLLSMALNDLGTPAISFTGSQAGILTSDSHEDAQILDISAFRVEESILKKFVVILAGFQGVSPRTKEITTIGRGGSDLSAVAMAAHLNANCCEILKEVPSIFTADPKLIANAKPIQFLTYDQLLDMTFWGAKVLHYRAVELAKIRKVKLYIGPAEQKAEVGTRVEESFRIKENPEMYESNRILSINSHNDVLEILLPDCDLLDSSRKLKELFDNRQIPFPQLLSIESKSPTACAVLVTGPTEVLESIRRVLLSDLKYTFNEFCSLTLTCTGVNSAEIHLKISDQLRTLNIKPKQYIVTPMSATLVLFKNDLNTSLKALHQLFEVSKTNEQIQT